MLVASLSMIVISVSGCAKPTKTEFSNDVSLYPGSEDGSPPRTLTIWHDSLPAAVAESRRSGKPILADFTGSDWCHWCVKLKSDVFAKPEFQSWARDNVVLLELDYPKNGHPDPEIAQQNEALKNKYRISSYPTVLILDADGNKLGKMGYQKDAGQWIEGAEQQIRAGKVSAQNEFQ